MATTEFLRQWRSGQGSLAILAKILLPRADGTQVDALYVSQTEVGTYADSSTGDPARLWQSMVKEFRPVHAPGGFGSTDLALCTGGIVLFADRHVTFPAGIGSAITCTLRESLSTHVWIGAKVTIWRYFHSLADFKHAQVVLKDAVITSWNVEADELEIKLRQTTAWNKPLTPRTVGRHEFPRAPDNTVGLSLPIVYGDLSSTTMRRPWDTRPTNYMYWNVLRSGSAMGGRYSKALLVDTGRGGAATTNIESKVYASGHEVMSGAYDPTAGVQMWFDCGDRMGLIYNTGYAPDILPTSFNTSSGAGMGLPDGYRSLMIGLQPREVVAVSNCALDPRNILEPSDTTYSYLDYTNLRRELRVLFAPIPDTVSLTYSEVSWIIGYVSSSNLDGLYIYQSETADGDPTYTPPGDTWLMPVATTPTIAQYYTLPWSEWSSHGFTGLEQIRFALRFGAYGNGGRTGVGTAKIFFVGMVVRVAPKKSLVQSERVVGTRRVPRTPRDIAGGMVRSNIFGPFSESVTIPAVTELRGDFYSNILGLEDDGTYTGTNGVVIQRAPDIMVHMLVNYGGVLLADIERGSSSLGSFVLARTHLAEPWGSPIHAFEITEGIDLLSALLWLTADSLTSMAISPYDGKWKLNTWRTDPTVDYTWKFSRYDLNEPMGPVVEQTALSDVVTGIRVAYDYDSRQGAMRSEVALSSTRSVAGYEYRGLRDGYMTVVAAQNDRFDFKSNFTAGATLNARTATLTAGVYVPQSTKAPGAGDHLDGFAQQLKNRMAYAEGTEASGSRYQVTWGTRITSLYNDLLTFDKGGVTVYATLPAGDYATCEALAAQAMTTANAALGSTSPPYLFYCAYDRPTNKFVIYAGVSSPVLKIKAGADYTAGMMQRSAWASLGFYHAGTDVTIPYGLMSAISADDIRIENHFGIMSLGGSGASPAPKSEFELQFQSGTNGADSATAVRHCGDLLGFSSSEDRTMAYSGTGGHSYCGDCPKSDRETTMLSVADVYGPRREVNTESRTIKDTKTALSLRDRIADLFAGPRTMIRFGTRKAPDIERGNVIEFSDDVDAIAAYPGLGSNASWAGKKFMVTEVVQQLGPTSLETEVTAVDAGAFASVVVAIGVGVMMGGVLLRLAS